MRAASAGVAMPPAEKLGTGTLDAVQLTNQAAYSYSLNHADLKLGPGPVNLQLPVGEDSTIQREPSSGVPASCAEKFVDFPVQ
jgi:polygalacturonase